MIFSTSYALTSGNVAADTLEFQRFLNDAASDWGVLSPGVYTFGFFEVKAGTRLTAHGAKIKCDPALASNLPLGRIRSGVLLDAVEIEGLGATAARSVELVYASSEKDITITHCKVGSTAYIGLALGACTHSEVLFSEFYGCGKQEVTAEGGPALWIGPVGATPSTDILTQGNDIHDNEWAGAYVTGTRLQMIANRIARCKEAGFFGAVQQSIFQANNINGITRKYISASGIEIGAYLALIQGNVIDSCQASNVALTDCQNVTVSANTLANPRQDTVYYPQGSGVSIITTKAAPNQPKWNTVTSNTFTGFAPPWAMVDIGGTGAAVDYVTVQGNACAGIGFASGQAVYVQPGKQGVGCSFQ